MPLIAQTLTKATVSKFMCTCKTPVDFRRKGISMLSGGGCNRCFKSKAELQAHFNPEFNGECSVMAHVRITILDPVMHAVVNESGPTFGFDEGTGQYFVEVEPEGGFDFEPLLPAIVAFFTTGLFAAGGDSREYCKVLGSFDKNEAIHTNTLYKVVGFISSEFDNALVQACSAAQRGDPHSYRGMQTNLQKIKAASADSSLMQKFIVAMGLNKADVEDLRIQFTTANSRLEDKIELALIGVQKLHLNMATLHKEFNATRRTLDTLPKDAVQRPELLGKLAAQQVAIEKMKIALEGRIDFGLTSATRKLQSQAKELFAELESKVRVEQTVVNPPDTQTSPPPSRLSTEAQTSPLPSRLSTEAHTSPPPVPSRVRLATAALVTLLMMVVLSLALNPGDASSASVLDAAPVEPCQQLSKQIVPPQHFLRDGVAPSLAVVISIGTGSQDEFADPIAAVLQTAKPYSPTAKAAAQMWRRNGLNSASAHRDVERYLATHAPGSSYIRLQPGVDIELTMDEVNVTALVRALLHPALLPFNSVFFQSSLSSYPPPLSVSLSLSQAAARSSTRQWLAGDGAVSVRAAARALRERRPDGAFVLTLDGGGMRGVITLEIVRELERHVGEPLGAVFDLIGGTSIGGAGATAIALSTAANEIGVLKAEILMNELRNVFAAGRTGIGAFGPYE